MATPFFDKSVFKKYFDANDASVLAWAENVLDKLKAKGGVAEFVKRQDEDKIDTDFDDLFLPSAIFFSYLVQLARQFEDFTEDDFLSDQYLSQHGQYTGGETLVQLVYAIQNSLRIRAQRGTTKMIAVGDTNTANGEILRLINWSAQEFFKLGVARPQYNSWNINNSSPCSRGNTGRYDLNVGYEYTEDIEDLDLYPLINSGSVFLAEYWGKNAMEIESVVGDYSGIGANDSSKRITVDPRINFEITFYVAQDITLENITFGCLAFDVDGNQVSLENVIDGSNTNYFFETRALNKAGRYYFVRGILYNKDQANMSASDAKLNIGFGRNLRMPSNVVSIIPYIVMDNNISDDSETSVDNFTGASDSTSVAIAGSASTDYPYDGNPSLFLWNIKVTPCSLSYERCYLNNKNFIDLILENKNGKWSNIEIKNILRKYFIPYNTAFNIINLDDVSGLSFLLLQDGNHILLMDGGKIIL